ncbi:heterokaryon incompatibility protein-domain-containing protein [Paraphoma chrysanthemicola]|nr:heterokaryon incompatibility protein-domain-containing protein [Paraphoma chrysanthemicola]
MDQNLSLVARGKLPLVPIIDGTICARCRNVLEQPSEPGDVHSEKFHFKDISDSVLSGCRICYRLHDWLERANQQAWRDHTYVLALLMFPGHDRPHYGPVPNPCMSEMRLWLGLDDNDLSKDRFVSLLLMVEPVYKEGMCPEKIAPLMIQHLRPANTRDHTTMSLISKWMSNCLNNHELCNAPLRVSSVKDYCVPTRLISANRKHNIRLITPDRRRPCADYRYATLTHRWQEGSQVGLSLLNMIELEDKIDVFSLNTVFQDAIKLCQDLDIDFLWIDRLCIIQDDPADLAREIADMGYIYEDALLNIGGVAAASQSARSDEGLFTNRSGYAKYNDPMCARVRRSNYDQLCWIYQTSIYTSLNRSAMMLRGWILQERLLSPRSIYFDYQLHWECSELLACEYFPDGIPREVSERSAGPPDHWGVKTPFKIKSLLFDARYVVEQMTMMMIPDHSVVWTNQYQCWMKLIERYSRCQLTHESDCFLALSGLAKHFAREFDDEYLAGLWRKGIYEQLLWYVDKPRYLPESMDNLQVSGAPTWSWASRRRDGIDFLFDQYPGVLGHFDRTAEIEDAAVVLNGDDPIGNVSSGMIRICGPLRRTLGQIRKRQQNVLEHHEWWDEGYYRSDYRVVRNNYHFLMGFVPYKEGSRENNSDDRRGVPAFEGRKIGLILESIGSATDVYRRVGVFMHICHTWDGDENYPKPRPGDCEEFYGFEPDNYERRIITII